MNWKGERGCMYLPSASPPFHFPSQIRASGQFLMCFPGLYRLHTALYFFELGSYCIIICNKLRLSSNLKYRLAQTHHQLTILLPQHFLCLDYRLVPPSLSAICYFFLFFFFRPDLMYSELAETPLHSPQPAFNQESPSSAF